MFSLVCALNKRLCKQSSSWWFETPSRSLWRHCNAKPPNKHTPPRGRDAVARVFSLCGLEAGILNGQGNFLWLLVRFVTNTLALFRKVDKIKENSHPVRGSPCDLIGHAGAGQLESIEIGGPLQNCIRSFNRTTFKIRLLYTHLSMHGQNVCIEFQLVPLEFHTKIFYPYIEW